MYNEQEVGKRIIAKRLELNILQKQLAIATNVNLRTLQRYENGARLETVKNIVNISDVLKVSTDYLLKGKRNHIEISDKNLTDDQLEFLMYMYFIIKNFTYSHENFIQIYCMTQHF